MALQIGALQADILGDESDLLRAEKSIQKTTKKINKDLESIERAAIDMAKDGFKPAAREAVASFSIIDKMLRQSEKEAISAGRSFSVLDKSIRQTGKSVAKTGKAANDAGKRVKGVGRNAGQAGIQFQQFVGQIQGGQNAFVALSQQAADMGFVLGAPLVGVIVSLAAVLGGVLFAALNQSKEAMEDAKVSAADLSKEYLKLTKQTELLAAVKLSESMLKDAAAAVVLDEKLKKLITRRDELALGRKAGIGQAAGKEGQKFLSELNKEIEEIENRLSRRNKNVESAQAELSRIFNKNLAEATGEAGPTNAPGAGGAVGGSTFDQLVQKDIAALQLRGKLFNDANAEIEAEVMRFQLAALQTFEVGSDDFLAAEQALADKRVELHATANEKIRKTEEAAAAKLQNQQNAARNAALNGMVQLGDQISQALENAGKEGTAIAKAVFLANKAIQVVSILAATQVAAANAGAVAALGGPLPFFATKGAIEATGFASAGLVAGLAIGETFENGGIVGGSSFSGDRVNARVNSGEMILNKGQQSSLFNMANGKGGGSAPNITVINSAPGAVASVESVTKDDVRIMVKRGQDEINASLASGRGPSSRALKKGHKVDRNIRT